MDNIENIEFDATKDEKEEINDEKQGEKEEIEIPIVGADESSQQGGFRQGKKRGKYKQKSWDEYVEDQRIIFEQTSLVDPVNSVIKINNIPNRDEFERLMTILKDEHGGRVIEFVCTEAGYDRFYTIFQKTGLFDVTQVIQKINDTFYSEYFREFVQLDLAGTIPERNKSGNGKEFYLHMSSKQKAVISRTLKYFKGTESPFGLACCIFTFNKAKEKFEFLRTDKFKVYYSDDGYAKIIQEEMREAAQTAIARLVEGLPILLNELEEKSVLASNSELPKYIERKEDLKYQIDAVDSAISVIYKNNIQVPCSHNMNFIVLKEKSEGTYMPPLQE